MSLKNRAALDTSNSVHLTGIAQFRHHYEAPGNKPHKLKRVCSHDVTSAMLEERYNEDLAILEEEINPVGGKLLFNANTFFCFRKKYMVAGHMSERTL